MAINSNFSEQATTTLNLWASKNFANLLTGHNPVFFRMRKNGNVQTGGLGIKALEPVMYFDPTSPVVEGVTNPYNELTPSETKGFSAAEYEWCEKLMSVSIPALTMDQQGSETRKINHLNAIKDSAMKTFNETLASELWRAEGAVGSNGSTRQYLGSLRTYINRGGTLTTWTGLTPTVTEQVYNGGVAPGGAAVGTSPLTLVGNIERNRAEGGIWCSPVQYPGSDATLTLANLNYTYNLAVRDNDSPDLIITNRTNFGELMSILQGYQRYTDSALADAGFQSIRYIGADVVFDARCPAKTIFCLNTKYLKLRCESMQPKFEFKPDPYRPILNWQARWVGQLTMNDPARSSRHARIGS